MKKINLVVEQKESILPKKIKKIAETDRWEIMEDSDCPFAIETSFLENRLTPEQNQVIYRLLSIKQQGYKSQDKKKELYNESMFVSIDNIVELLKSSKLICFYCNLPVKLVYKYVRDLKQWSLERVDNDYGHNRDNIVIACLDCNIRRRTIYQERYKKTKEMYHVVKLGADGYSPKETFIEEEGDGH